MKFFVGITDNDWFSFLAERRPDELNFWRPGGSGTFKAIAPGDLFLFKLHSPLNFIVGGGTFVSYTRLPLSLAWLAFAEKNGVPDETTLRRVIQRYRGDSVPDPEIGCIVLSEPFFFPRELWIPAPADWPRSAVQGKTFDTRESESGRKLFEEVRIRRAGLNSGVAAEPRPPYGSAPPFTEGERYSERLRRVRLGQGGFKVLVTDAYERRCAITGEKTLPVLEAAHIQPFAENGPHRVDNGILLRADMHILFDRHYLTITPDQRILVSKNIQQQFTNGKLYYSYHEMNLRSLPADPLLQPGREYLERHNERFFRAQAAG